ncbi:MAG: fluoride efflux transporter CrcB [Cyanobacteria bacterium J06592_8]
MRTFTELFASISDAFSQPMIRKPIAIGLGAIAGAVTRYYLTVWLASRFGTSFPYGTFFVNLTGCFIMGCFTVFSGRIEAISPELILLLGVGFLGSYTTFSTYELDTHRLLQNNGVSWIVFFYWMGSAVLGVIGIQLGLIFGRLLIR